MKIDRSKINLLAEGPNKLRVGDRVRLYNNRSATIVSTTAAAMRNCIPPPIVGQYDHNGNTRTRTWHADGLWIAASNSNNDIVAIIRPARSEPLTEVIFGEIARARAYREYWSFDCVASGLLK